MVLYGRLMAEQIEFSEASVPEPLVSVHFQWARQCLSLLASGSSSFVFFCVFFRCQSQSPDTRLFEEKTSLVNVVFGHWALNYLTYTYVF